jgi:hypothetical protein
MKEVNAGRAICAKVFAISCLRATFERSAKRCPALIRQKARLPKSPGVRDQVDAAGLVSAMRSTGGSVLAKSRIDEE